MRRLSLLALAALCSAAAASAQTVPTKPSDHGMFDGGAFPPPAAGIVTHVDLSSALSSYVTQTALNTALDAYLPLTGGNTTGALNGYSYFPGLVGSSASGSTVTLTTDNSGNLTTANCMVIPGQGATEYDINIIGVSSNGADAFLQRFSGVMSYRTNSGYVLTASSSSNNYPAIGSDHGTVAATVAADTNGCLRLTATGGGSGSWKWRAGVHYENLVP